MSLWTLGPSCGGLCKSSGESREIGGGEWGAEPPLNMEVMKLHGRVTRQAGRRGLTLSSRSPAPQPAARQT